MDQNELSQRQYDEHGRPIHPSVWQQIKRFLAPIGVGILVFFKYLAKLKFLLPVLKTGGTMILSIWVYVVQLGARREIAGDLQRIQEKAERLKSSAAASKPT